MSVVKLGQATGRAADTVARLVVIPPVVAVPGTARIVGPHRVVRLDARFGWGTTIVGRPGAPNSTSVVRATPTSTGIDSGRRADRGRGADCARRSVSVTGPPVVS